MTKLGKKKSDREAQLLACSSQNALPLIFGQLRAVQLHGDVQAWSKEPRGCAARAASFGTPGRDNADATRGNCTFEKREEISSPSGKCAPSFVLSDTVTSIRSRGNFLRSA